jgi:hypothetical protein
MSLRTKARVYCGAVPLWVFTSVVLRTFLVPISRYRRRSGEKCLRIVMPAYMPHSSLNLLSTAEFWTLVPIQSASESWCFKRSVQPWSRRHVCVYVCMPRAFVRVVQNMPVKSSTSGTVLTYDCVVRLMFLHQGLCMIETSSEMYAWRNASVAFAIMWYLRIESVTSKLSGGSW